MSDARLFSAREKDNVKESLYHDYKAGQIKQLEDDYKEIKELNKKFQDACQKFFLKPEKDFRSRFWDSASDLDVLNVKYAFWQLHSFFREHYCFEKSKDHLRKIENFVTEFDELAKLGKCDSLNLVMRWIVDGLPALDKYIEFAYQEKSRERLKNLPLEFYTKLAQIDASMKPQYGYCKIL